MLLVQEFHVLFELLVLLLLFSLASTFDFALSKKLKNLSHLTNLLVLLLNVLKECRRQTLKIIVRQTRNAWLLTTLLPATAFQLSFEEVVNHLRLLVQHPKDLDSLLQLTWLHPKLSVRTVLGVYVLEPTSDSSIPLL